MRKRFQKACVVAAMVAVLGMPAMAADLMEVLPAETLFVVRANNLEAGLGQLDQFLMGINPAPVTSTMMVRGQLSRITGDPMLNQIQMGGDFAMFGYTMNDGRFFQGALIPVQDFQQMVSGNQNLVQADQKGVYKVLQSRDPEVVQGYLTKIDSYVLYVDRRAADVLPQAAKQLGATGSTLKSVLAEQDLEASKAKSLWAYANVQELAPMIRPKMQEFFDEMHKELNRMGGEGQNQAGIGNIAEMYRLAAEGMLEETKYVAAGLEPMPQMVRAQLNVIAVEGSVLGSMLVGEMDVDPLALGGYLRQDAWMNVVGRVNEKCWSEMYSGLFDVMEAAQLGGEEMMDAEAMQQMRTLTQEYLKAMGDSFAFTMLANDGTPMFTIEEVVGIEDADALRKLNKQYISLINEGAVGKFYKALGLDMQLKMQENVATYKGVQIDAASLEFGPADQDDQMGAMIRMMYGDGLVYRWATAGDRMLVAMGENADQRIRQLIDQARSDTQQKAPQDFLSSIENLTIRKQADFLGTLNYARMMQMGMKFAFASLPRSEGQPAPEPPQIDVQTKSNVAFGGVVQKGRMNVQLAVPKQHVQEVMAVAQQIGQQMQKQMEMQMQEMQKMQQNGNGGQP